MIYQSWGILAFFGIFCCTFEIILLYFTLVLMHDLFVLWSIFLHGCIDTFTSVKDLSTSSINIFESEFIIKIQCHVNSVVLEPSSKSVLKTYNWFMGFGWVIPVYFLWQASGANELILNQYLQQADSPENVRDVFTEILGDMVLVLPVLEVAAYHRGNLRWLHHKPHHYNMICI